MKIVTLPTENAAADHVASLLATALRDRPDLVLGLATGRTMERVYATLLARNADLAACRSFNLDEYLGLAPGDPRSYRATMQRLLFAPARMNPARTHVPDGICPDRAAVAMAYERAIAQAGGIDLQILGIGVNGHVGFNEPGTEAASRTRDVTLSEETRGQNALLFGGDAQDVPERAITMGLATILAARRIVLLATGARKAAIVAAALKGPIGPFLTASLLRDHPECTIVLDREAAGLLA